ncbi:hypothetical protein ACQEVI_26385 [Promicromonospora sp. CA-289599]|uniref:hypothetical protein n=1 Tax=Promicromonospora sp. CA-289599 TaxID=3240014 RepID=UPI003D8E5E97
MHLTRPDLARILDRSAAERPTAELGWLDAPPARARVLRERVVLGPDVTPAATADALFG